MAAFPFTYFVILRNEYVKEMTPAPKAEEVLDPSFDASDMYGSTRD